MNTGADVSYLLKARQALKESEDAERAGDAMLARWWATECILLASRWDQSIKEKEAA